MRGALAPVSDASGSLFSDCDRRHCCQCLRLSHLSTKPALWDRLQPLKQKLKKMMLERRKLVWERRRPKAMAVAAAPAVRVQLEWI
mmetsp:Transcript_89796/g.178517  ORF Transcript_89796/g.178517 Transcript_89796/m.178517 type:complete len:86 (+) Transcript_89796:53-310(+)